MKITEISVSFRRKRDERIKQEEEARKSVENELLGLKKRVLRQVHAKYLRGNANLLDEEDRNQPMKYDPKQKIEELLSTKPKPKKSASLHRSFESGINHSAAYINDFEYGQRNNFHYQDASFTNSYNEDDLRFHEAYGPRFVGSKNPQHQQQEFGRYQSKSPEAHFQVRLAPIGRYDFPNVGGQNYQDAAMNGPYFMGNWSNQSSLHPSIENQAQPAKLVKPQLPRSSPSQQLSSYQPIQRNVKLGHSSKIFSARDNSFEIPGPEHRQLNASYSFEPGAYTSGVFLSQDIQHQTPLRNNTNNAQRISFDGLPYTVTDIPTTKF